jgi:hypothetical protein
LLKTAHGAFDQDSKFADIGRIRLTNLECHALYFPPASAKANNAAPEGMTTYCFPSNE